MKPGRFRRVFAGVAFVALFAACTAVPAGAAVHSFTGPAGALKHGGRWITDSIGRVVILHGVNMVSKVPPYTPKAAGFSRDDAAFLRRNGFDTVRLGVIYSAVEAQPGHYDEAYITRIKRTEQMLASYGIYSLIDFHQDLYNERFQGEGFPAWAVQDDGLPAVPQRGFPGNYLTMPALNRAFDHFWANDAGPGGVGLQDRYAAAWGRVATRFHRQDHVLGYDVMNEPWPGTVFATCANPTGCPLFDQAQLKSFYQRTIAAIRQGDRRSLIFYEPLLTFDFGAQTSLPNLGDHRAGFTFHDYCLPGAFGAPDVGECPTLEEIPFQNADSRAAQTNDALLLSEFGATDDLASIRRIIDLADQHMVSWQYWHYCGCDDPTTQGPGVQALVKSAKRPPRGNNVKTAKLAVLERPYPQAIAGTPRSFSYDPATRKFTLVYTKTKARGGHFGRGVTEVFVPRLHYRKGYSVATQGANVISAPGARILQVKARAGTKPIRVVVTPAT